MCVISYAPEGPGTLARVLTLLFSVVIPMIIPIIINVIGYIYVIIKVRRIDRDFYIRVKKKLNKVIWYL